MKNARVGTYTGIGLMVGVVLYALTDGAYWIAFGLVAGAAIGSVLDKRKGRHDDR